MPSRHSSAPAALPDSLELCHAGNTTADGADNYAEATLRMQLQGNTLNVLDYFRPADYAYLDTCA